MSRSDPKPEPPDEREAVHVVPLFGREHEPSGACWCGPTPDAQDPHLIVHRVFS